MGPDRLSAFQRALLEAFFRHEHRFFLTGGAALAGFHLGHRETQDLDFFVSSEDDEILLEGEAALEKAARELGATVEATRTAINFRRRLVKRPDEGVIVDLVRDVIPPLADKLVVGSVRVDSPREILANKLCTLLSRSEFRDLVDVRALEGSGLSIETALADASTKDAGITPATLLEVLSGITIGDEASLPGGVPPVAMREWIDDLRHRLRRLAWPLKGG